MEQEHIKLFAEIKGERHEVSVLSVNETTRYARVAVKQGEPFISWTHGGWAHDRVGRVRLDLVTDEFGRAVLCAVPVEFHTNIIQPVEAL